MSVSIQIIQFLKFRIQFTMKVINETYATPSTFRFNIIKVVQDTNFDQA